MGKTQYKQDQPYHDIALKKVGILSNFDVIDIVIEQRPVLFRCGIEFDQNMLFLVANN